MRKYQEEMYNALVSRKNYYGSNVVIGHGERFTEVFYYGNKIAVIDHADKTATLDNCGFNNASTTARINAVKEFCKDKEYKTIFIKRKWKE